MKIQPRIKAGAKSRGNLLPELMHVAVARSDLSAVLHVSITEEELATACSCYCPRLEQLKFDVPVVAKCPWEE